MRTDELTHSCKWLINDFYPNSQQRHLTLSIIETFRSSSFMLYISFCVQFSSCDFLPRFQTKTVCIHYDWFPTLKYLLIEPGKKIVYHLESRLQIYFPCALNSYSFSRLCTVKGEQGDVPFFRTRVKIFEAFRDTHEDLKCQALL